MLPVAEMYVPFYCPNETLATHSGEVVDYLRACGKLAPVYAPALTVHQVAHADTALPQGVPRRCRDVCSEKRRLAYM